MCHTRHPPKNHPWKKANLTISGIARLNHVEQKRHVYAMDENGAVYIFQSGIARNEWLREDEGRQIITALQARTAKAEIEIFDSERERVLIDKAKQRRWREKRMSDE